MRKPTPLRIAVLAILAFTLVLSGSILSAQKIDKSRPAVYLSFQEFAKRTGDETYQSEGARLVIHNNTRWPVYYGRWSEPVREGDVAAAYMLELETGCVEFRRHVDVVTRGKLMPGKTASFLVPLEDFPANSKVYLEFEFSWELRHEDRVRGEAIHRAYFRASDLPR